VREHHLGHWGETLEPHHGYYLLSSHGIMNRSNSNSGRSRELTPYDSYYESVLFSV
jgi:hypothetical protein